jgi:hypothetical protein
VIVFRLIEHRGMEEWAVTPCTGREIAEGNDMVDVIRSRTLSADLV